MIDRVMTRRGAIAAGLGAGAAVLVAPSRGADKGPRLDDDIVQAVVGAGHRDLERVRSLVDETPALVRAAWDWGGGDFETSLGAAAHTGRKAIARFLLSRGAPMDLFAAAMLGHLGVVRATIEAMPESLTTPGPHGIPLLAHAKRGGEEAAPVVAYLESLGAGG